MFQKVAIIKYSHLRFDNKLTLADVDRLSKFFHQVIRKKILYVHITKISTSSAIYICDGRGRTGILVVVVVVVVVFAVIIIIIIIIITIIY